MELIFGFVLAVLGIIAAAVSRQLADEFKAWTPWIIGRLVKSAVRKLPEDCRDRFEEEWLSHIHETPGEVGKLTAAVGFLFAAWRMSSPVIIPERIFDILFALPSLIVLAPVFLFSAMAINLEDGGPIFVTRTRISPNGRRVSLFEFRTIPLGATAGHTRVGRLLQLARFNQLPSLINLLRGDSTWIYSTRPLLSVAILIAVWVGFITLAVAVCMVALAT
jgi:hypothetical protein